MVERVGVFWIELEVEFGLKRIDKFDKVLRYIIAETIFGYSGLMVILMLQLFKEFFLEFIHNRLNFFGFLFFIGKH